MIGAHDVVQATNCALMLNSTNMVDMRNVFDIFHLIVESEGGASVGRTVAHYASKAADSVVFIRMEGVRLP